MPGEMVIRVARVLEPTAWRALGICDTAAYAAKRESSVRKSRAAIEAMRDPTSASCVAGWKKADERDAVLGNGEIALIWSTMIDAALQDGEG